MFEGDVNLELFVIRQKDNDRYISIYIYKLYIYTYDIVYYLTDTIYIYIPYIHVYDIYIYIYISVRQYVKKTS